MESLVKTGNRIPCLYFIGMYVHQAFQKAGPIFMKFRRVIQIGPRKVIKAGQIVLKSVVVYTFSPYSIEGVLGGICYTLGRISHMSSFLMQVLNLLTTLPYSTDHRHQYCKTLSLMEFFNSEVVLGF